MGGSVAESVSADDGGIRRPRVLRDAISRSATTTARRPGYNPACAVTLAKAHRWADYAAVVSALRDLAKVSFDSSFEISHARGSLARLGGGMPFSQGIRFLEDEIYVCLDRPPLGPALLRLQRIMARAQVSPETSAAENCNEFFDAVHDAMEVLTRDDDAAGPAIYDRSTFESVFLLEWMDGPSPTTSLPSP